MGSPRRWPVVRLFSRNPLIRRSDRVEALTICIATILALLAIPLAVLIEGQVHTSQNAAIAHQAATIHPVKATAVDDATAVVSEGVSGSVVTARWTYQSVSHTDTVNVDDGTINAGDPVNVWVDPEGNPTHAPLTAAGAALNAAVTATAFYLAAVAMLVLIALVVRGMLGRFRGRGWDMDLALLTGGGDGRVPRHW